MKYQKVAENHCHFNFVFYEVEKNTMYVFCPNCGSTHEITLSKTHNVKWTKENVTPCSCFEPGTKVEYKHSSRAYEGLNESYNFAEFERFGEEVKLCGYWLKAEFGASNYNGINPFYRYPVFTANKVFEIYFKKDNSVKISSSLYVGMFGYVKTGRWQEQRNDNWHFAQFLFDLIYDSLTELKGTILERYLSHVEVFLNAFSNRRNIEESSLDEIFFAWLVKMHTNEATKKLWFAGYHNLVFDKVCRYMTKTIMRSYYGYYSIPDRYSFRNSEDVVNWRGRTLEKILRIHPSKLDMVLPREDFDTSDLEDVISFSKAKIDGVELCKQNVELFVAPRRDFLISLLNGYKVSKIFKYCRAIISKYKYTSSTAVSDYYDYIDALNKLDIKLTKDVVFPSDFKKSHDRMINLLENMYDSQKEKNFEKAVHPWLQTTFRNNDYVITAIKSIRQLKKEAAALHNCAATYVDRIIRRSSVIFTIKQIGHTRRSYYMLELNPKNLTIVQNRGINNIEAPDTVKQFAKQWLEKVVREVIKKQKTKICS